MSAFSLDEDTLIAIAAGLMALVCLVLGVQTLRKGKVFRGGLMLTLAAAAALICYFFKVFTIRLL